MDDHQDSSTSTPWPVEAVPEQWVGKLFSLMASTYGKTFADQWRGLNHRDTKIHWGLHLAQLTDQQLRTGAAALSGRMWPPTLPEFMAMCRPQIDPEVAYHEAAEQGARRDRGEPDAWSHPAVYWAWIKMGRREVATHPYSAVKARWDKLLGAELAQPTFEPVPAQVPQIAAPGKSMTSPAQARAMIAQLRFKDMKTGPAGDGRQWARKVLADVQAHTIDCVKLAQQALERA